MPHVRKSNQKVDAFSLPVTLSEAAKARASELGMTVSGFYRYCLSKELGCSEAEAKEASQHRAVLNSIEAAKTSTAKKAAKKAGLSAH